MRVDINGFREALLDFLDIDIVDSCDTMLCLDDPIGNGMLLQASDRFCEAFYLLAHLLNLFVDFVSELLVNAILSCRWVCLLCKLILDTILVSSGASALYDSFISLVDFLLQFHDRLSSTTTFIR